MKPKALLLYSKEINPVHTFQSCFLKINCNINLQAMPRSCHGAVSVATRYELGGPRFESQQGKRFYLPKTIQTSSGAHPASCPMGAGVSPSSKQARVRHWPLTSVQCQAYGWMQLYFYSHYIHGMDTQNFTSSMPTLPSGLPQVSQPEPLPPHVPQALPTTCCIYIAKFYIYILTEHGNDVFDVSFSDTPI